MITIVNKKTGERKQIQDTQLGEFGLAPTVKTSVSTPDTGSTLMMPTEKPTTSRITFEQLKGMSLDPKVKPATYNRIKALYDLQLEEDKLNKETTDEIKLKDEKENADKSKAETLGVVDELLQRDTGAITGLKNPIKSITGENKLTKALYDQLKSLLSLENRQKLKGSGAISDYEFKVLEKSSTALNTDLRNEDFENELLKIKGIISGTPIEKRPVNNSLLDTLTLGGSRRVAQDIGAGLAMNLEKGTQEAFNETLEMADNAEKKAELVTDPKQKAALLKVAQDARASVSKSASELSGKFSEDIDKGYGGRAFGAATEIAAAAGIPSAVASLKTGVKTLTTKAPGFVESVKSLAKPTPAKMTVDELLSGVTKSEAGKKVREKAIKKASDLGKKVDGTKVYNTIKKQLSSAKSTATPSEIKQIDELISSANKYWNGKSINPKTAKLRWDNAVNSYKQSGVRGDTVKSMYDGSTRDGIRKELDRVAPGFEKGTKQIAEGIKIDKLLKPVRNSRDRKLIKDALEETPSLLNRFAKKVGSKTGDIVTTATVFGILDFLKGRKKTDE